MPKDSTWFTSSRASEYRPPTDAAKHKWDVAVHDSPCWGGLTDRRKKLNSNKKLTRTLLAVAVRAQAQGEETGLSF